MQRGDGGYRLVAASVFSGHWRLADKFGRPLQVIHEPVPGFGERLADPVDRFFANPGGAAGVAAQLEPGGCAYPVPAARASRQPAADQRRAGGRQLWLRVERQTLRRLPRSADVVFGIHTYVDPLEDAIDSPEAAQALAARIREMPDAMARYKSILPIRAPLLAWLDGRAEGQGPSAGR